MEAMEEKKLLLESHFLQFKAKYGLFEDKVDAVIVVEATPSPGPCKKPTTVVTSSVSIKGPPGKYTKEALLP